MITLEGYEIEEMRSINHIMTVELQFDKPVTQKEARDYLSRVLTKANEMEAQAEKEICKKIFNADGMISKSALAAAFSLAQELPEDAVIVISETEYTGAGKHVQPQLDFARDNGIDVRFGDPDAEDKPGVNVILPKDPSYIRVQDADLDHFRQSLIKKSVEKHAAGDVTKLTQEDLEFLAVETKTDLEFVKRTLGL